MTTTPAGRRGLFTTDPDQRLRPGNPDRPWELWLTGPNTLLPMPDLATALMAAAEHNALAADLDDGSPLQPATHAVVLRHGYAWRREGAARPGTGIAVPSLCWTARCSVCGDLVEDEYIPHHDTPEDAADDAVGSREWDELPDRRLVCDRTDDAHDEARTQAHTEDIPELPDESQLALL
ncbi:hypothetical protein ADK60_08675 [Streptomyces sp. XY431]|uniref:hypothetical protein n=1 Tax=Streptomyces sp. XY431 TaxID=1415562 RepID=UPI0006AF2089|nr:hypothetical protein [Streptomyces sp. XY431]KOV35765.1 hypothetical protein ADK60_08675 [Streptomyces sp. XY431]